MEADEAKESISERETFKSLIKLYYKQLTKGCGDHFCENIFCSTKSGPLTTEKALEKSMILARDGGVLCIGKSDKLLLSRLRFMLREPPQLIETNEYLKKSFSHQRVLEFIAPTQKLVSEKSPEIDFQALDELYMLLKGHETVAECFQNLFLNYFQTLGKASHRFQGLSELREFLLALEFWGFEDPGNSYQVLELCKLFQIQPKSCKDVFRQWLQTLPKIRLEKYIATMQTTISILWHDNEERSQEEIYELVQFPCLFLEFLFKAIGSQFDAVTFQNDIINEMIDLEFDFHISQILPNNFSVSRCSFLLVPQKKAALFFLANHQSMVEGIQQAVLHSVFTGQRTVSPFLVLSVHRDALVEDSIVQLQMKSNQELTRPLRVKFIGEEGVDEGGVRKEFFLLLVRELFDLNYGMFILKPESNVLWFNQNSFESSLQFELIGITIGLAIYNGVILDLHFPQVVFKKLLGLPVCFEDLKGFDKELYDGLVHLRDFQGNVEETFMRTFTVEYEVFGERLVDELKENGNEIALNNDNRNEFIELYVDYVFNRSIKKQFDAFLNGFSSVCHSPMMKIFTPEDLELLICGSVEFDFQELEQAALYQDGYDDHSPVIKWLWEIVHEMDSDFKRKFLAFCTGTDRVPIAGLGSLELTISRNGPDSEILPTAHTCFNHLMIPQYSTKERLQTKLFVAIENYEGFGLQ